MTQDAETLRRRETFQRILLRSAELYSLPRVAMEVLRLTSEPQIDAARLKACIEVDPALTAKLLAVVNSSLFGVARKVSDPGQALALLGSKSLRLLVLGFSVPDALFAGLAGDVLVRYWRHALTRAVFARELAQKFRKNSGDEAFTAGLLLDLGLLVLIQGLGKEFVGRLREAWTDGPSLAAFERSVIGCDHARLTAELFSRWNLPATLILAVTRDGESLADGIDRRPRDAAEDAQIIETRRVLALACALTEGAIEEGAAPFDASLNEDLRKRSLGSTELEELAAVAQAKVETLAEVLSIDLPEGRDYRDLLSEAHQRLAGIARDAAGTLISWDGEAAAPTTKVEASLAATREALRARPREAEPARAEFALVGEPSRAANPAAPPARSAPPLPRRDPPTAPSPRVGRTEESSPRSGGHAEEVDPAFFGRLDAAVRSCRAHRQPLSLLLVEVDRYDDLVFAKGTFHIESLMAGLASRLDRLDADAPPAIRARESRIALLLPHRDRMTAAELGHELLHELASASDVEAVPSVSVGVATVAAAPRNFPPLDLYAAAERCLFGAQAAGGNCVKGIEIY